MKGWPKGWLWKMSLVALVGLLSSGALAVAAQDAPAAAGAAQQASTAPTKEMLAENAAKALSEPKVIMDTLWVVLGGMLVFFMNLGFACVETGLCRAKNAVNILSKNFVVFAASTLGFWVVGWGLMFGDGNAFVGTSGLFFAGGEDWGPLLAADLEIKDAAGAVSGYHGDYAAIRRRVGARAQSRNPSRKASSAAPIRTSSARSTTVSSQTISVRLGRRKTRATPLPSGHVRPGPTARWACPPDAYGQV